MPTSEGGVRPLTEGTGSGPVVAMTAPLSLWGGLDPATGRVLDAHHPQAGTCLTGAVVLLPGVRGSNAGGAVLLECVRLATAPAAILLSEPNQILPVGAILAEELYGVRLPIVVVDGAVAEVVAAEARVTVTAEHGSARIDGDG